MTIFTYIKFSLLCIMPCLWWYSRTYNSLFYATHPVYDDIHVLTILCSMRITLSMMIFMYKQFSFLWIMPCLWWCSCTYNSLFYATHPVYDDIHVLTILCSMRHTLSMMIYMYIQFSVLCVIPCLWWYSRTYNSLFYASYPVYDDIHVLTILFSMHNTLSMVIFISFLCIMPCLWKYSCTIQFSFLCIMPCLR